MIHENLTKCIGDLTQMQRRSIARVVASSSWDITRRAAINTARERLAILTPESPCSPAPRAVPPDLKLRSRTMSSTSYASSVSIASTPGSSECESPDTNRPSIETKLPFELDFNGTSPAIRRNMAAIQRLSRGLHTKKPVGSSPKSFNRRLDFDTMRDSMASYASHLLHSPSSSPAASPSKSKTGPVQPQVQPKSPPRYPSSSGRRFPRSPAWKFNKSPRPTSPPRQRRPQAAQQSPPRLVSPVRATGSSRLSAALTRSQSTNNNSSSSSKSGEDLDPHEALRREYNMRVGALSRQLELYKKRMSGGGN